MKKTKIFFLLLPLILLATDLWYSVINNLIASVSNLPPSSAKMQLGSLPFTADTAISGLQVSLNLVMALWVSFGFCALALLYKRLIYQQRIKLGGFKILGFLIVFAFSLPAFWGLYWQIVHLSSNGTWQGVSSDIRYLTIALLLPYPSLILSIGLFKYYKTQHKKVLSV